MEGIRKIIGIGGFIIILFIMYRTDHGIPGIQKYDPSFRLLDMRFHYSSETVRQTFDQIQEGGRIAYQKYLLLDFMFILCFFQTMIAISDAVPSSVHIRTFFYLLCALRALFDISENTLLLYMLRQYPIFNGVTATVCAWFTTVKFAMLSIWLLSVTASFLLHSLHIFPAE